MTIAVIGGSGFQRWAAFTAVRTVAVQTPYATEPVSLLDGTLAGHPLTFIPRHGSGHSLPPHRVNYRANIWALKEHGAHAVVAIATVGGISSHASPGSLMIPDQILDYTYGRGHTFFDGEDGDVAHADMTEPYCETLRRSLLRTAERLEMPLSGRGTYAATQGPRFETPAEIRRLERDGADVVGMTGMPEAALARELQLPYAAVALVANPAAGRAEGVISMEQIREVVGAARHRVEQLLAAVIPQIENEVFSIPAPMRP